MNRLETLDGRLAKAPDARSPFSDEQQSLARGALESQEILSGRFWGELRVFLAVAKAKSFSRAATPGRYAILASGWRGSKRWRGSKSQANS